MILNFPLDLNNTGYVINADNDSICLCTILYRKMTSSWPPKYYHFRPQGMRLCPNCAHIYSQLREASPFASCFSIKFFHTPAFPVTGTVHQWSSLHWVSTARCGQRKRDQATPDQFLLVLPQAPPQPQLRPAVALMTVGKHNLERAKHTLIDDSCQIFMHINNMVHNPSLDCSCAMRRWYMKVIHPDDVFP